jgi:hypothetical protein
LAHAFARHFADGARRALIIGTDTPGIDRRLVTEAFTALGGADLVLGPTTKGGVYLIGLRGPAAGAVSRRALDRRVGAGAAQGAE